MVKRYFDKTGKEIKAGMTIYFGTPTSGSCIPVVQHKDRLCFDDWGSSFIPLDDIDLSDCVIEYDPEEAFNG